MTRHFLTLRNISAEEINRLLTLAIDLKAKQKKGVSQRFLDGKSVGLIFEKPSNRTRVSFEVGVTQLGGHPITIQGSEIKMGERETVADVARTMSRYVDAVAIRAFSHETVAEFAAFSSVPVINGLTDLYHPCQALADVLTIKEKLGALSGLRICYIGDGNNVCRSLILAGSLLGFTVIVSCPHGYRPEAELPYEYVEDPVVAAKSADVIYTDVWTSMGQEEESAIRKRDFAAYTVTSTIMANAKPTVLFMHCLPAHRGEEVSEEVFESPSSVVFDQAENRLHAQKAVLVNLIGKQ